MVLNFSGPAQALANLLRLDIADFVNQVLLGGRAVGRGAAVEAAKVDVARGDVGELVSKDELSKCSCSEIRNLVKRHHAGVPVAAVARDREVDDSSKSWMDQEDRWSV